MGFLNLWQCADANQVSERIDFPRIIGIVRPYNLQQDPFGKPVERKTVVESRGLIIAPKRPSFKAVDAIVPPRHLIKVTVNRTGHVIDGPGLLAASKVILQPYTTLSVTVSSANPTGSGSLSFRSAF